MASPSLGQRKKNVSKIGAVAIFLFSTLCGIISYTSYLALRQQVEIHKGTLDNISIERNIHNVATSRVDYLDKKSSSSKKEGSKNIVVKNDKNDEYLGNVPNAIFEATIKDEKDSLDWVLSADCMKPLDKIIGAGIVNSTFPSRILNVGMPKAGSTSLYHFFQKSGEKFKNLYANSSHHICKAGTHFRQFGPWHPVNVYCGHCIKTAIEKNLKPLSSCGDHLVWTQMDVEDYGCYFPQISALEHLYYESPTAVLLLPFRSFEDWIRSVGNWINDRDKKRVISNNLRERLTKCDIDGLPRGKGGSDDDFKAFVCNHVKNVRRFVLSHPRLTLIEFNMDDKSGEYLAQILPGLDKAFWDVHNANNITGIEKIDTAKLGG